MYDTGLIAAKLRRWEKYLQRYRLPCWEDIPDIGLYMEQVIVILHQYLNYLPPELKEEQPITSAAINNYVRNRVMPMPVKKKYYRMHIAYLIMICSLKQGMSISMIQKLIPWNLSEEELSSFYCRYTARHEIAANLFVNQVKIIAGPLLGHEDHTEYSAENTEELIATAALAGGFARLMADKLLWLEGKTESDFDDDQKT